MSQVQLRDLILDDKNTISVRVALMAMTGLPSCVISDSDKSLAVQLLERQFNLFQGELMKVAGIKENQLEFRLLEFNAAKHDDKNADRKVDVKPDKKAKEKADNWYPFQKRTGYISCFASFLERDEKQERGKSFDYQPDINKLFEDEVLNNCFHNVYQLLAAYYNDKSHETAIEESQTSIPLDRLAGKAILSLVNVWDIGLNRAILHLLTLLAGYLHYSFPILTLKYPDDEHLVDPPNISENEVYKGVQPIMDHYSRAELLVTFSHLGRSFKCKRKKVCQVVLLVGSNKDLGREHYNEIAKVLFKQIQQEAERLGTDELICDSPEIVDQNKGVDFDSLKIRLDQLIQKEPVDIPLSWFFLRSAFFKTGQLYIETSELEKHAAKCRITADKFKEFLSRFTGFGSIIHIPDIPVFCNYVILNPADFFHKLTELFYPRFNGDLQYGIASFSTLRRLYGKDLQFFLDFLISCRFAIEIRSNRIIYADKRSRLPIAEPCLYIPTMRTQERLKMMTNKFARILCFLSTKKPSCQPIPQRT